MAEIHHEVFVPCPQCGQLLLCHVWEAPSAGTPGRWVARVPPVTAALGRPHACAGQAGREEAGERLALDTGKTEARPRRQTPHASPVLVLS